MGTTSALSVIERPSGGAIADLMDTRLDPKKAVEQVQYVQQIMAEVMKDGEHYGVIPGTGAPRKCSCGGKTPSCEHCHGTGELGPKKTLLKAGAEKLCYVFRLAPQFEIVRSVEEKDFILFDIRCLMIHTPSGLVVGTGMGSCSSREEKYGWRKGGRECPECHKAGTIIRGKAEYAPRDKMKRVLEGFEKGGFLCFKKKDGCGATFRDDDAAILGQSVERVPNENIWEQHNTMFKMAQKRALIAATLVTTACSDIFTQDLDDISPESPATQANGQTPAKPAEAPATKAAKQPPRTQAEELADKLPESQPGQPHARFSDDDAMKVPKPLRSIMHAYNALLTLTTPEECASVPETYFRLDEDFWEWDALLKTTNAKFLQEIAGVALPKMEQRIAFLEKEAAAKSDSGAK